MATQSFISGVPTVFTAKPEPSIALGSLVSLVPLACTIAFDSSTLNNDRRSPLENNAQYQFLIALRGIDDQRKGYTETHASQGTGIASVTNSSTQGILITVAASAWPANSSYATAVDVWMKKGSGNYYLHSIVPIDTSNTWQTMIFTEVNTTTAVGQTLAQLQSSTANNTLGSRDAIGVTMEQVGTTQDGVAIEDTADTIQYRPDQSTNYNLVITRGMTVTFTILENGIDQQVKSRAGELGVWTDGGVNYKQANTIFQASGAVTTGNAPLKIVFPPDPETGAAEEMWMFCTVTQIQTGGSMNYNKTEPVVTQYIYETINNDSLLQQVPAVCARLRWLQ